jgi:glycosyltransferase involved in cell wall biosynthesis
MSVSVIIPSWNRKELLARTLENVLSQTLPPSEVIVVDDHSTDGTIEFITDKFDKRVTIITNTGKGPGAARNTGFRRSTGRYIKFFDSDDLMTLNTLETQVRALENTGKGCVYNSYFHAAQLSDANWQLTDPAILQDSPFPSAQSFSHWMLRGLFITIPSFLFTRELITKVGKWRTDITAYEDWDFQWRVAKHEAQPAHTNECAFLYRKHGTQTTGVHFNESQRDREKIICFTDILRDVKERNDIGPFDRVIFETFIANTLRQNSNEQWAKDSGINWNKVKYKISGGIQRLLSKQGRVVTGTNWQPMHGPRIDYNKVRNYLTMIDPSFRLELTSRKN